MPEVTGIAGELAEKLEADCRRDLLKVDDRQTLSRGELLEKERAAFLPLPATPFRACREEATHASKQLLVRFDGNDYSVPTEHAHRSCVARGFVDRVEIEVNHEPVAVHPRSYGQGQFVLEPLHYLKLLERKPGSLDNARPFKAEWGGELDAMRKELEYRQPGGVGTKQFIDILLLMLIHSMQAVKRAVGVCVSRRAYSVAAVVNVLRNEAPRAVLRLDLSSRDELSGVGDGIRPLSIYDQLSTREDLPDFDEISRIELARRELVEGACPEFACRELVERVEGMVLS